MSKFNLPVIDNPQKWAAVNRYILMPMKSFSGLCWFVVSDGDIIGTLRQNSGENSWTYFANLSDEEQEQIKKSKGAGGGLDNISFSNDEVVSTSSLSFGLTPISMEKQSNTKDLTVSSKLSGTGHTETIADCNFWLPFAAEQYQLSPRLSDYVLVPIPAMFSALPNTKGDSLTLQELLRFDTFIGRQVYKTFQGKPNYYEHANSDIKKAKGVILDAFLRKIHGFGNGNFYKLVLLQAFDRTKDPELANSILTRKSNAYSVGFTYNAYECTVCGHRVGAGYSKVPCSHTNMKTRPYKNPDGRLVYRHCLNARGYECSSVASPAFVIAIGPHVMDASSV